MSEFKFKYLEVAERPANFGPVIKRIDVTEISRKARNRIWHKLDEEYDLEQYVTRYNPSEEELKTM